MEKQTKAYITNEPKSFAELQKRLLPRKEKLATAKVKDEAFDAKRAEETKLLQRIPGYNQGEGSPTSDHFIIIVGKGIENAFPYLEYLDPGTGTGRGYDKNANRLYPIWKNDVMYWYDPKGAMKLTDKNNKVHEYTYLISSVCVYPKDQK